MKHDVQDGSVDVVMVTLCATQTNYEIAGALCWVLIGFTDVNIGTGLLRVTMIQLQS